MSKELSLRVQEGLTVRNTKIISWQAGKVQDMTPILLLDISGSMQEQVSGKRKIDILREAVNNYPGIIKYVFSETCYACEYIPEPQTDTRLSEAFRIIQGKGNKVILISDGEPTTINAAMDAGLALKVPVDCLYIGEPGDSGEIFMQELAAKTGGQFIINKLENLTSNSLSDGIGRLLLGVGDYETTN